MSQKQTSKVTVLGGHGKVAMLLNRLLTDAGHDQQTGAEPLVPWKAAKGARLGGLRRASDERFKSSRLS